MTGLQVRVTRTTSPDGRRRWESVDIADCTDQEIERALESAPRETLLRWVVALAGVIRRGLPG